MRDILLNSRKDESIAGFWTYKEIHGELFIQEYEEEDTTAQSRNLKTNLNTETEMSQSVTAEEWAYNVTEPLWIVRAEVMSNARESISFS